MGSHRLCGRLRYLPSLLTPDAYFYYPPSNYTTHAGYRNRHTAKILPDYDPSTIRALYKYLRKFVCHPREFSRTEYAETIGDTGKRKYYLDYANALNDGTAKVRNHVTAFTKLEKTGTNKYKAPRLIQARHVTFNIEYGRWLKALEIDLTKHHRLRHRFGKGNYDEIARRITRCAKRFRYTTEVDHTEFDSHITREHLELSHTFYKACYPTSQELPYLCNQTLRNRVRTYQGDRWEINGTRMSGDVDTSLGNSIINYALLSAMLHDTGIHDFEIIVNGDDSILFTNIPVNVQLMSRIARKYNMNSKINASTDNIHHTEFCRTKLVIKPDGQPTMMFNPKRAIDIFGMHYKHLEIDNTYLHQTSYANSVMHGNTALGNYWLALSEQYATRGKVKQKHYRTYGLLERKDIIRIHKSPDNCQQWKELTQSMFVAWGEEIWYFKTNIVKLTPRTPFKLPIIINHQARTLTS
uniref:RNA-directed RNA polymerase n=1 Tax=Dipteran tombus-related virus TaxID=2822553 RepID=A0A8A6RRT6_9TOMB|nr:RNA-dependent RNA polymerase [Dipteran tombus-related virus]